MVYSLTLTIYVSVVKNKIYLQIDSLTILSVEQIISKELDMRELITNFATVETKKVWI